MPLNDTKPLEAYLETLGLSKWGSTIQMPSLPYKLSADAEKHSYWEVDTSSFHDEVMQEFNKGNLILNHKIHSCSILMKKEVFESFLKASKVIKDFNEWCAIERKIEETYFDRSEKIEGSGVLAPGYIFNSPVADGHANYIVTKVTKASIHFEHLHFGDRYRDTAIESFDGKMSRKQFDRISFFGRSIRLAFRKSAFG